MAIDPKDVVDKLMNKPMNRKEFLAHVGVGMVSLIGVSAAIKNLGELGKKPTSTQPKMKSPKRSGFGGGSYGS